MLAISQLPGNRDAPVGATLARCSVGIMLHRLLDAVCEGLAAHQEYERLVSTGMHHDRALRTALSISTATTDRSIGTSRALSLLIADNPVGEPGAKWRTDYGKRDERKSRMPVPVLLPSAPRHRAHGDGLR
jgi:hypothetical protein